MANVAILVGNTNYQRLNPLVCCGEDLIAIKELIDATGKFEAVDLLLNCESSQLKDRIRAEIDRHATIEEIFFYFTGHGYEHEAEFYFCATNFDARRPNETGLSNSDLHTLLRSTEAELVVKVIDACSSGSLLIKSDGSFLPSTKQGFRNLIQFGSCLDSQSSLAGDPLSLFTDKFRTAALRKTEGAVYYTDIIDALRDEFIDNNTQTPHFVQQGTGREQFVENAKRLDELRAKLASPTIDPDHSTELVPVVEPALTPLAILERAEQKFANKDRAQTFIADLFGEISAKVADDGPFRDLFTSEVILHPDFREPTTRSFIIRALNGEKRPDNFVTAEITYEQRKRDPFGLARLNALWMNPDDAVAHYELRLNCSLDQAQLKLTLVPKFISLKMFVLVITCAPSLGTCYVFEMLTQHSLQDWGIFDAEGSEVVRRWYKKQWTDNPNGLVDTIFNKLNEVIQTSIDSAAKALLD